MSKDQYTGLEIAIVGMAGKFPGAASVAELWTLLKEGQNGVSSFDIDELIANGVASEMAQHPGFVPSKGIIGDIASFDHEFFGFTAREAEQMSPQVRVFLECAWAALEDAGYDPYQCKNKIGMFAGANPNLYWSMGTYLSNSKNFGDYANKDMLSTRVAYKLDLKGPALTTFTACSTSLVTIHQACRSLLGGECDMALAGGISIDLPEKNGYVYQEGMILSKDGKHRSFDNDASGAVFGDGVGVVMLKPLEDAIRDKDQVYAVIKGTAINNDGSSKVGYTAPSIKGQVDVIKEALQVADVSADSISYVECHGSATSLGDPMEVEALIKAFGLKQKEKTCAIGSVKSNVGHLNIASGVIGIMKAALSLYHQKLPPTVHFKNLNAKISLDNTPFYVNDQLIDWQSQQTRRAGVSSFGIGGTNAHAILEEYLSEEPETVEKNTHVLLLSAQSETALQHNASGLAEFLDKSTSNPLNVAFTLATGRKHFTFRKVIIGGSAEKLAGQIRNSQENLKGRQVKDDIAPEVVMVYSATENFHVNMGRRLFEEFPLFRSEMTRGLTALKEITGVDLLSVVYPAGTKVVDVLTQDQYGHALQFITEYALTRLLDSFGVKPSRIIGEQFGVCVAACIAGSLTFKDALRLVTCYCDHAALADEAHMGSSTAKLDENTLSSLKVAYYNIFKKISVSKPKIPFYTDTTNIPVTFEQIKSSDYWLEILNKENNTDHVVNVRGQEMPQCFVSVGLSNGLIERLSQKVSSDDTSLVANMLASSSSGEVDDLTAWFRGLGDLWMFGYQVDWSPLYENTHAKRISIPTYAFDKNHFWLKDDNLFSKVQKLRNSDRHGEITADAYKEEWKLQPINQEIESNDKHLITLAQHNDLQQTLSKGANKEVAHYKLSADRDDWSALLDHVRQSTAAKNSVIYLVPAVTETAQIEPYWKGFGQLIEGLVKADTALDLFLLSHSSYDVDSPLSSQLAGLLDTAAQHVLQHSACGYKRVVLNYGADELQTLSERAGKRILSEVLEANDHTISLRQNGRFVQSYEAVNLLPDSALSTAIYDIFIGDIKAVTLEKIAQQIMHRTTHLLLMSSRPKTATCSQNTAAKMAELTKSSQLTLEELSGHVTAQEIEDQLKHRTEGVDTILYEPDLHSGWDVIWSHFQVIA
ncbi:MAG: type I polyketide synthase, partial [Bacteroidota bacterium]